MAVVLRWLGVAGFSISDGGTALLQDPYVDLIASVEPDCLCHGYYPNQVFVGRPAAGRQFPVPLPADVRLVFRGADITANIIHPVTADELRFRIPPNSETGALYLRGLFPAERGDRGGRPAVCSGMIGCQQF